MKADESAPLRRFWAKVDRRGPDECWPWKGCKTPGGYGMARIGGQSNGAHRVAYRLEVGPIPAGLQLDHLCRNRACCNPSHLEPVSGKINTLRGETLAAANAAKTHCARGHEFSSGNTRMQRVSGGRVMRVCRECSRQNMRRFRSRQ